MPNALAELVRGFGVMVCHMVGLATEHLRETKPAMMLHAHHVLYRGFNNLFTLIEKIASGALAPYKPRTGRRDTESPAQPRLYLSPPRANGWLLAALPDGFRTALGLQCWLQLPEIEALYAGYLARQSAEAEAFAADWAICVV